MATVTAWTPFGVALNITATAATVTRTSATKYTVKINASWASYYSGNKTNYGMTASSGGSSVTLNPFGTKASSGSGSFTGTYSISGNGSATKTITVTFRNFNNDNGNSATKNVTFNVAVPAWTSYKVSYNANGGSGAPSAQTKWKDQVLTLSSTKPTRTGYAFQGWATSASGSVAYAAGANYTSNATVTLYAVWKAHTYTVKYDANGGTGAPSQQTKTYGVALTLSSTKPTRINYIFKGWGTSSGATTVAYAAGASYTANAAITLYAIWELAYTKPRITNFTVARCNSNGTTNSEGLYALVRFSWACDYAVSSVKIEWKLATASSYSSGTTITASGTSGMVNHVAGAGLLATSSTYTFRVIVTDSNGSSDRTVTLSSLKYSIHAKPGGDGVAFGKAAETSGLAECEYNFQANKRVMLGKYVNDSTLIDGGIKVLDLRNSTPVPAMFGPNAMNVYFDQTTEGSSNWRTILSLTGWDTTYATHELSFNAHNNVTQADLYHRTGILDTWQAWRKILDSTNFSSYALPLSGGALTGDLTLANAKHLYGKNTSGVLRSLAELNASNQAVFGYGGYSNNEGASYYDGNVVNIRSKGAINITSPTAGLASRAYGVNKVLWTGGYYMTAGHTASLSEKVSAQPHGIVILFQYYNNGAVSGVYTSVFIPKYIVPSNGSVRFDISLCFSQFALIGIKALNVYNDKITGHDANNTTGTGSNIAYNNAKFVLTHVIGV